ncbi:hypothetical protein ABH945_007224 [Paraburkholderia sp. GAS333]|uniref:hypothetical protein n=1 Tax=Paraburkholderia sp. GAS333 TaxID=3156279 RepID=UPI003D1BA044
MSMTSDAKAALNDPEVLHAMKTLSKYGLGVLLVHSHTPSGHMVPLPKGQIGLEDEGRVSFMDLDDADAKSHAEEVAWIWNLADSQIEVVMKCRVSQWCEEE